MKYCLAAGGVGLNYSYSTTDFDTALQNLFNDLPESDEVICGIMNVYGVNYSFWGQNIVHNTYSSLFIHNYFGKRVHAYLDNGVLHVVDL